MIRATNLGKKFRIYPSPWGRLTEWLTLNRGDLTIFAHANTGEDLADHTRHVIWFGPSETLDLTIFD